jgi:3-hydroxyacyl-CoA dehydrogenase
MTVVDMTRITVVGAGLMGHGIAQEFAVAGYEVQLHDQSAEVLGHAIGRVESNLEMFVGLGMVVQHQIGLALSLIQTTTGFGDVVTSADLVVDMVFEDLALKHRVLGDLDRKCDPRAILATNTST